MIAPAKGPGYLRRRRTRPRRRSGHAARGVSDRREPQWRRPADAPARRDPVDPRARGTAPSTARRPAPGPRLRPPRVPPAGPGSGHQTGHRPPRSSARLRPWNSSLGRRATIAQFHGFRHLRVRRERHDDIHETFLDLATCLITHRHVQHLCRDFLRGGGNERCRADQGSPGLSLGAESTRFPLMGRLWWSSAVRGPGHRPVPGRGHDHGTGRCASPQPRIRAAQRLTSYARPQEATD